MNSGRFVILKHDSPFVHWDFMLQRGDVLATWRLLAVPELKAWLPAERLADHRTDYLDYEGPVSGNRGTVKRVMAGHYQDQSATPWQQEISITNCSFACLARLRSGPDYAWWFE